MKFFAICFRSDDGFRMYADEIFKGTILYVARNLLVKEKDSVKVLAKLNPR